MCMFCRSLFVLLYFFFWPLCCMLFFDIRILITPSYLQTLPSMLLLHIFWNCSYSGIFCFSLYCNVFCCCVYVCVCVCARARVCVCVCVCVAFKNNGETLCICCILYKLYICVLLIIVCQSWFVNTGNCCKFPGLLCASAGGGKEEPHRRGCQVIIRKALLWSIVVTYLESVTLLAS